MERPANAGIDERAIDIGEHAPTLTADRSDTRNAERSQQAADALPNSGNVSSSSSSSSSSRRVDNCYSFALPDELVLLVLIAAAVSLLYILRAEHSRTPLFVWIIGYVVGCIAAFPHHYWHRIERNSQPSEQDSLYVSGRQNQSTLIFYYDVALYSFFAVLLITGSVLIFGGHSTSSYRWYLIFLLLSCLRYAIPIMGCTIILCCCVPCIVSLRRLREGKTKPSGATIDSINCLPIYKFQAKYTQGGNDIENNAESGGGILAAGTDKERIIMADDAMCCICLENYADNEDIRELQCNHLFHIECSNNWLKINSLCPICKSEAVRNVPSSANANVDH